MEIAKQIERFDGQINNAPDDLPNIIAVAHNGYLVYSTDYNEDEDSSNRDHWNYKVRYGMQVMDFWYSEDATKQFCEWMGLTL